MGEDENVSVDKIEFNLKKSIKNQNMSGGCCWKKEEQNNNKKMVGGQRGINFNLIKKIKIYYVEWVNC